MDKLKDIVMRKRLILPGIIIFETVLFGMYIIIHDHFLRMHHLQFSFINYLDSNVAGVIFVAIAVAYGIACLDGNREWRRISVVAMFAIWAFYFISFFIREFYGFYYPVWIFMLGMILIIYYEMKVGDYR
ncbi:hypothetical protein HCJ66_15630 [Listeria sp. FSL L7-1582]|uniref:hypothetical protein n=1 Tax=Listeria portnoyi TaxID=2713504 RepID=UPI00164CEE16|nr:hypothetical protein [Listeria portnoyi]MBC6310967.1 hypothetical protein [Listeria portnoyi]